MFSEILRTIAGTGRNRATVSGDGRETIVLISSQIDPDNGEKQLYDDGQSPGDPGGTLGRTQFNDMQAVYRRPRP